MTVESDFLSVFAELTQIMRPFGNLLVCTCDDDSEYYINTSHIMKNKKSLFFGAVQIRKNYVSYHLMPVYVFPALLKGMSPELKKRMQGKSCFNFKTIDRDLFEELSVLTASAYEAYEANGYV